MRSATTFEVADCVLRAMVANQKALNHGLLIAALFWLDRSHNRIVIRVLKDSRTGWVRPFLHSAESVGTATRLWVIC